MQGSWGTTTSKTKKLTTRACERVELWFQAVYSLLADEELFTCVPSDSKRADLSAREMNVANLAISRYLGILAVNSGQASEARAKFVEQIRQMYELDRCSHDFLETFLTVLGMQGDPTKLMADAVNENNRRRQVLRDNPIVLQRGHIMMFVLKAANI